ncbi:HMCN [Mytilus edulis]|uniref:HMCN n=1 Tax=Mytilus edulis TaxID=6550 RepID=A0A8S3S8R2_MYTED|nr:HMCN [Mytilus edulis]
MYNTEFSSGYSTSVTHVIHLRHENQTCACIANINGYIDTAQIQIYISKYPHVEVIDTASCNRSEHTNISCTIFTEVSNYGFSSWIHSYRGAFLRYVQGNVSFKESILLFESCSLKDEGDYTCIAWNEHDGTAFYANNTFRLYVNSPPVIVSAMVFREHNTILSVQFCSASVTTHSWSTLNKQIGNSPQINQSLSRKAVEVIFYNKTIDCNGYISNLTLYNQTTGKYELVLINDFGETKQAVIVELLEAVVLTETYDLRLIVFGLMAIGIFIVTATGTVIILRSRCNSNLVHVLIVGPHEHVEGSSISIYHAATSSEPVVHTYDTTNPDYLEVIDYTNRLSYLSEHYKESEEDEESQTNSIRNDHDYEEID